MNELIPELVTKDSWGPPEWALDTGRTAEMDKDYITEYLLER